MGLETVALIMAGISAVSSLVDASEQAKATIKEGNIAAKNKATEVQLKAARLQSSFLSSGLTLEGTPEAAVSDTFKVGLSDIEQIRTNYNTKAKNIISAGRTQALSTMASAFVSADLPDIFGSGYSPIGEIPGGPTVGLSGQNTWNWQK